MNLKTKETFLLIEKQDVGIKSDTKIREFIFFCKNRKIRHNEKCEHHREIKSL